jgi:uncharacterized protein YdcH (DUF465 family)
METLKDFFSDLKERISNPFISSFMIAWIIFNYTILIALLFYKQTELKTDGYTSYLNLIHRSYNMWRMVWYPLIVAAIYTFIVPFFKSLIKVFQAWILTTTDGIIYRITKQKVVSVELHTEVLRTLDDTKAQYVTLINSGSAIKAENEQLKVNIHELNSSHANFVRDLIIEHGTKLNTLSEEVAEGYRDMLNGETTRFESLAEEHESLSKSYELATENINKVQNELKLIKDSFQEQRIELNTTYERLNEAESQIRKLNSFSEAVMEWRKIIRKKSGELDKIAMEKDEMFLTSQEFTSKLIEYITYVQSSYPNALEPK